MIAVAIVLLFACAGACGAALAILVAGTLTPFDDGPAPRRINPLWAVCAVTTLGIVLVMRHAPLPQLGLVAAVSVPLVAAWYCDTLVGLIPDWFTLAPLGLMAIYMLVFHAWIIALSAAIVFVPFAITAFVSKGVGMGWGDVKLATFAAAVLGVLPALATFAAACLGATVVGMIRDRGKTPVAFGPYLAGGALLALAFVA